MQIEARTDGQPLLGKHLSGKWCKRSGLGRLLARCGSNMASRQRTSVSRRSSVPEELSTVWGWVVCLLVCLFACSSGLACSRATGDDTQPVVHNPVAAGPANALPTDPTADQPAESLWTRSKGEDWPRMLGVHYDSRSSESGVSTDWGPGLPIRWSQKTGIGYGNGVAAKGRWLQFDRFGDVERLSCYRAETGEFLWKWEAKVNYRDAYGYNDGPRCSPVVDDDRVYVYGVAGTMACVRLVDGSEVWSRNLSRDYHVIPNFFGVGASPLVHGDLLLAMVGGSPKVEGLARTPTVNDAPNAQPNGTGMVALDKRTGQEIYRVGMNLASYSAPVIAKLGGVEHCVALMREGLLVFRAVDGQQERFFPWRAAMLESVNAASPVVFDDHIFISEAYELGSAMLRWVDGDLQLLWRDMGGRSSQSMRTHWATPIFDNHLLYASSGRNPPDTDLRCIDVTGDTPAVVRWSQRNRDRGTGLLVDSHFLWLGEKGKLQLMPLGAEKYTITAEMDLQSIVDKKDGQPLINPPSWAPPVLSHGLLYVRGADRVVCLELIPQ